jgi:8-oxo-dGTP pyrophosphatase MutT (NUDIX family)
MASFRVTVATVVRHDNHFLMGEERDKQSLQMVYNQPAGHLEVGESIIAGAKRETLEETGCTVSPTAVLSVGLYRPKTRPDTYCRITLAARLEHCDLEAQIDSDIHRVLWMSFEQIWAESARLRSPMVLDSIQRYQSGESYPISMLAYYES